jgi:hypothetical protein
MGSDKRSRADLHAAIDQALLAGPERSDRDIAQSLACSHTTVGRRRKLLVASGQLSQHVESVDGQVLELLGLDAADAKIPSMRARHAQALRERYPHADPDLVALGADLLTHIALARQWIDRQGGIVQRARKGSVFEIVTKFETWQLRLLDVLKELRESHRLLEPEHRAADYRAVIAGIAELVADKDPKERDRLLSAIDAYAGANLADTMGRATHAQLTRMVRLDRELADLKLEVAGQERLTNAERWRREHDPDHPEGQEYMAARRAEWIANGWLRPRELEAASNELPNFLQEDRSDGPERGRAQ